MAKVKKKVKKMVSQAIYYGDYDRPKVSLELFETEDEAKAALGEKRFVRLMNPHEAMIEIETEE